VTPSPFARQRSRPHSGALERVTEHECCVSLQRQRAFTEQGLVLRSPAAQPNCAAPRQEEPGDSQGLWGISLRREGALTQATVPVRRDPGVLCNSW